MDDVVFKGPVQKERCEIKEEGEKRERVFLRVSLIPKIFNLRLRDVSATNFGKDVG